MPNRSPESMLSSGARINMALGCTRTIMRIDIPNMAGKSAMDSAVAARFRLFNGRISRITASSGMEVVILIEEERGLCFELTPLTAARASGVES